YSSRPTALRACSGSRKARKQSTFRSRNLSIPRGRFALHAAPLATVVDPTDEQGEVTDAERVVNLGSRDLKGIVEVAHISPRAIVAPVRATAFAYREERVPFDLWIGQRDQPIRVART